jgi:hypothetical protein
LSCIIVPRTSSHLLALIRFSSARARACQKADWRNHKKHCGGKEKVAKRLPGTIHDHFWQYPVPDTIRHVQPSPDGTAAVADLGFGVLHPSRTYSPALQRQISLLEGDRGADYFLFDDFDRLIRFMIYQSLMKLCLRTTRARAIYEATPIGGRVSNQGYGTSTWIQPGKDIGAAPEGIRRKYGRENGSV